MTTEEIIESGMKFGPYPEGHCFYIEKSETYEHIRNSVKIAEFLLIYPPNAPKVWIVEAKSSSPRPETERFDCYIEEIREKLTNALNLCVAICLKRHCQWRELPIHFQTLDLEKIDFRLILVINGHKDEWLPPLQDTLKKKLNSTVKTWNLSPISVAVLNEKLAKEKGLIGRVCQEN